MNVSDKSFDKQYSYVHKELTNLYQDIPREDRFNYKVLINKHEELSSVWMYYCYYNNIPWETVDKGEIRLKKIEEGA